MLPTKKSLSRNAITQEARTALCEEIASAGLEYQGAVSPKIAKALLRAAYNHAKDERVNEALERRIAVLDDAVMPSASEQHAQEPAEHLVVNSAKSKESLRTVKLAAELAGLVLADLSRDSEFAVMGAQRQLSLVRDKAKELVSRAGAVLVGKFAAAKTKLEGKQDFRIPLSVLALGASVGIIAATTILPNLAQADQGHTSVELEAVEETRPLTTSSPAGRWPFPITIRKSTMGFFGPERAAPVEPPSAAFLDLTERVLTLATYSDDSAREHMNRISDLFAGCVKRELPCRVETMGVSLDARHGLYTLSMVPSTGFSENSVLLASEYDGDIHIDNEDALSYVENRLNWTFDAVENTPTR